MDWQLFAWVVGGFSSIIFVLLGIIAWFYRTDRAKVDQKFLEHEEKFITHENMIIELQKQSIEITANLRGAIELVKANQENDRKHIDTIVNSNKFVFETILTKLNILKGG